MTILSMENNSPCLCFGCGARILDRWLLCVSPYLQWHTSCLKCSECGLQLDEKCTCFMRNGKAFCKSDFIRRLEQGEHFTILKDETLLCKNDFEQIELANSENNFNKTNCRASTPMSTNFCPNVSLPNPTTAQGFGVLVSNLMAPNCDSTNNLINSDLNSSNCSSVSPNSNSNSSSGDFGNTHLQLHHLANQGHLNNLDQIIDSQPNPLGTSHHQASSALVTHQTSSVQNQSINSSNVSGRHSERIRNSDQPKQTRIRTVLNDRQLQTLRSVYNQNPRPDALMKEQLVKSTGLSPRVIRVWFQNKRCKDKKKNNQIKQQQQLERESYCSDIHVYEPNWSKFEDHCNGQGPIDCSDPHFQHFVSQMNGYDTKDQKWNQQFIASHLANPMNLPPDNLTPLAPSNVDNKNGIQLINSTDCSSNGSVLMNGSSNSNSGLTLINPLINSGNGSTILNNLTTFDHNDLRRSESVLSALRPDTPSDLSN